MTLFLKYKKELKIEFKNSNSQKYL